MHKSGFLFSVDTNILNDVKKLNLDSVFIGYKNASSDNISLIKQKLGSDIDIYVRIPVFSGQELLDLFPDARPVDAAGKETSKGSYVGLCPTHEGVRKEALKRVKNILEEHISGIWLDSIRYPTKWEESEPDVLDTCYCDRCLKLFEKQIGEPIKGVGGEGTDLENTALHIDGSYYHEWLEFKTDQISSLVKDVRKTIDESSRSPRLGFFTVPWQDKDYGAGIKRILGQDLEKLSEYVDVVSPMLYHKMLGKNVEWINELVEYYWQVGKPFLPLVQTENTPIDLSPEEFKLSIQYASTKPSMGVCLFYLNDLVIQPEKFKIAKDFLSKN